MYGHLNNNFPRFLYNQSSLEPIVKGGGGVWNGQKIKLTKMAKTASGIKCKGEPVPLVSVVLTGNEVIDGVIVIKYSHKDCKIPT